MQTKLQAEEIPGPFHPKPLKRVGFLRRLIGSYPKINALLELNNMLASRKRYTEISLELVDILNQEYRIDLRKRFASDLLSLYKSSLRHCLNRRQLSDEELEDLVHLVKMFGITSTIHENLLSEWKCQEDVSQSTAIDSESIFLNNLSARVRAESPEDHRSTQKEEVAQRPEIHPVKSYTWLIVPTIAPGGTQAVAGEGHYQPALLQVCGGRTENGTVRSYATGHLVREPQNRYDKNAVRVDIGGKVVSYLPAKDAKRFHPIIQDINKNGKPATCRIRFTGGWDRGDEDTGFVGIELDVDPRIIPMRDEIPFLPQDRSVQVVGEQCCQEWLESVIQGKKKHCLTALLSECSSYPEKVEEGGTFILVTSGKTRIGGLQTRMETQYLPLLQALISTGCPATCRAEIWRAKKRLEVTLFLPEPDICL